VPSILHGWECRGDGISDFPLPLVFLVIGFSSPLVDFFKMSCEPFGMKGREENAHFCVGAREIVFMLTSFKRGKTVFLIFPNPGN